MRWRKVVLWTLAIVGGLITLVLTTLVIVSAFHITISLESFRGKIESAATEALGRKVDLEGPIKLHPSLWPALEIEGFRIHNPKDWEAGDFVRVNLFRAQMRILPLLDRKIHIEEITGDGIEVNLETNSEGQKNWILDTGKTHHKSKTGAPKSSNPISIAFVEVEELSLRQLRVTYRDKSTGPDLEFKIDMLKGAAVADGPLHLDIEGAIQKQHYFVSLNGDPIRGIFEPKQAWRMDLSGDFAGAKLNVNAQFEDLLRGEGMDFAFQVRGSRLEDLLRVVGPSLPLQGPYALSGRLAETESGYRLSKLEGQLGETTFTGNLDAVFPERRPRFAAELHVGTLDVGPFVTLFRDHTDNKKDNAEDKPPTISPPENLDIALDVLQQFDADIEVTIIKVINASTQLPESPPRLVAQNGFLSSPTKASSAQGPFRCKLSLSTLDDSPKLDMALSADNAELGFLAQALIGTEDIRGHLTKFEFRVSSRGKKLRSLLEHLDLHFVLREAALSYGHEMQGKRVNFNLDTVGFSLARGVRMKAEAKGKLLNVPFNLAFSGGSMAELLKDDPWPLELSAHGAGAKLHVLGTVIEPSDQGGPNLRFKISGKSLGELAPWLGVSPEAHLSYGVSGQIKMREKRWDLSLLKAYLGKTKLSGDLGWEGTIDDPLVSAKLTFDEVDLMELGGIFESEEPGEKRKSGAPGIDLDVPILPQRISIADADVDFAIHRAALQLFEVTDLKLSSRIRNGHVEHAPFQASIADTTFKGEFALDLRSEVHEVNFQVRSGEINIGHLLQEMKIAEGIESTVGRLEAKLLAKGRNLRDMLGNPDFSASMKDGQWILRDPNTNAKLNIKIDRSALRAHAREPVTLVLENHIKEIPINIEIQTDPLATLLRHPGRIPLDLRIQGLDAHLQLSSTLTLPIVGTNHEFVMSLNGMRIDSANELLEIDLPPFGPYELGGKFGMNETGYYVSDLKLRIKNSELTGNMSLKTTGQRPHLDVDFTTKTLQINDFAIGDWSPVRKDAKGAQKDMSEKPQPQKAADEDVINELLSPEVMGRLDARLALSVEEVLSGEDRLGSGIFKATLDDGRFSVDPLRLDLPGGSADLSFAYEPTEVDVEFEARAQIEQFDYGVLARRVDSKSQMKGWFSLDMALNSRAKTLEAIMQNASGYLDFAIVPEDFEAGVFELWAVNLLAAALTRVDSEAKSVVNCVVFRFNLEDGLLQHDALFVDTTKMQVSGEAKVDFKTEEVYLLLTPRAKKPEYFSLATPIKVDGTISKFNIGVPPGGILGTAVRFITSPIHVTIRRMFGEKVASDGRAACSDAMHRPHE